MKCKNCNNQVQESMHYCPYCGYDLTGQIREFKNKNRRKKWLVYIAAIMVVIIMIIANEFGEYNKLFKNKNQLNDMVTTICSGDYDTVYTNEDFSNQGIYQCRDNKYVYYVHDLKKMCGYYICGQIYELGYTYNKDIEEIFPNTLYFYRESHVSTVANELKIAVRANSEEDLINNYASKFYQLVKKLNKKYDEDLELMIYFNNSLSGINTTYDKLFMMAGYNTNNVTQSNDMGRGYGDYIFYDGDPYDLLSTIFADKNNYPTNARNALKNNRNVKMTVTNGATITFEEFISKFKNSFQDSF